MINEKPNAIYIVLSELEANKITINDPLKKPSFWAKTTMPIIWVAGSLFLGYGDKKRSEI